MDGRLLLQFNEVDFSKDFDPAVLDKIDTGTFFALHTDECVFAQLLQFSLWRQDEHDACGDAAHEG